MKASFRYRFRSERRWRTAELGPAWDDSLWDNVRYELERVHGMHDQRPVGGRAAHEYSCVDGYAANADGDPTGERLRDDDRVLAGSALVLVRMPTPRSALLPYLPPKYRERRGVVDPIRPRANAFGGGRAAAMTEEEEARAIERVISEADARSALPGTWLPADGAIRRGTEEAGSGGRRRAGVRRYPVHPSNMRGDPSWYGDAVDIGRSPHPDYLCRRCGERARHYTDRCPSFPRPVPRGFPSSCFRLAATAAERDRAFVCRAGRLLVWRDGTVSVPAIAEREGPTGTTARPQAADAGERDPVKAIRERAPTSSSPAHLQPPTGLRDTPSLLPSPLPSPSPPPPPGSGPHGSTDGRGNGSTPHRSAPPETAPAETPRECEPHPLARPGMSGGMADAVRADRRRLRCGPFVRSESNKACPRGRGSRTRVARVLDGAGGATKPDRAPDTIAADDRAARRSACGARVRKRSRRGRAAAEAEATAWDLLRAARRRKVALPARRSALRQAGDGIAATAGLVATTAAVGTEGGDDRARRRGRGCKRGRSGR